MAQNQTLDKIKQFVENQVNITKNSIVIQETDSGYRVNKYDVRKADAGWKIIDKNNCELFSFRSLRIAILTAALLVKKKYCQVDSVPYYDLRLETLRNDKKFYEMKIDHDEKTDLFEARLCKTMQDLEYLNISLSELEKSVGLH